VVELLLAIFPDHNTRGLGFSKERIMKKVIVIAITSILMLIGVTACGDSQTWQEGLAEALDANMSQSDIDDLCAGFAILGIDTPEKAGAVILGFADDDIPPGDVTVAEWVEMEGASLDNVPSSLDPNEVTMKDLASEMGKYLISKCE
jgi:hypothetical protein